MNWIEIMPDLSRLDVVVGTPVRIRPGYQPVGWVEKNKQTITVRPWGEENTTHCMIIDDTGTSMPVTWESLTIDLYHPLGFAAALQILNKIHPSQNGFSTLTKLRNAWLFQTNDEDRQILAASLVKHLNTTHREV